MLCGPGWGVPDSMRTIEWRGAGGVNVGIGTKGSSRSPPGGGTIHGGMPWGGRPISTPKGNEVDFCGDGLFSKLRRWPGTLCGTSAGDVSSAGEHTL